MPEHTSGSQRQLRPDEPGRQRVRTELDSESTDSEILLAIADLIVNGEDLPGLFKKLVPLMQALAKCDVVSFALYDAAQNGVVTDFWRKGQEAGLGKTFAVHESPCGWVWEHQEPLIIADLEQETRFAGAVQEIRALGVRSYTALPMSTPQRNYGALGVGASMPETEGPPKLHALLHAVRMVGLAIENRELQSQWRMQRTRLKSLESISSALSTQNSENLIALAFASVRNVIHYDYARLGLLEPDSAWLRLQAPSLSTKKAVQAQESSRIRLADAMWARAIATRSATIHRAEEVARVSSALGAEVRSSGLQSLCSVPLLLAGRVLGIMLLGAIREHAFTPEDGEYLQQVATQIAAAVQYAASAAEAPQTRDRPAHDQKTSEAGADTNLDEIVGYSPALKRVLGSAAVVAQTDATVLITGETGTGKERIARAIHFMSRRRNHALIKLNCAAIPTGLLESELFGHEKGAFTGAVSQKVGRLELADKGSLLLDEVGEIPLELQPKLLRVLQDQEFERLGGTRTIRVDVRLIAASNRDLERAVADKLFRSDLFYRLHVFPLRLPALRDRREDIPLLIRHFVAKCAARLNKRIEYIPDEAVEIMMNYEWPGNIRELENFIERSVILSEDNRLRPPLAELRSAARPIDSESTLRELEREHIIEVLRQTGGVLSGPGGAAHRLGLKRTTLQYKMQKLGISRNDYLA